MNLHANLRNIVSGPKSNNWVLVGIWVIVCIEEPSHHFLQTFRHYECLRLCSAIVRFIRNNCLYFCLLWLISASAGYITNFCSMIGLLHELKNNSCQHRSIQAGPQPEGGKLPDRPPKFLKTYVFVRYSNKLHHFAPPKISVGCGPAFRHLVFQLEKRKTMFAGLLYITNNRKFSCVLFAHSQILCSLARFVYSSHTLSMLDCSHSTRR